MKQKSLLFIGDSITEWGKHDTDTLGTGYVRLIHDYIVVSAQRSVPKIVNKGVGGNRIIDLSKRWQEDVIRLQPDIVSISIGINDVWRQLDQPNMKQVLPEAFEAEYRSLIEETMANTSASIVMMEPTIIGEEVNSIGNQMLQPYVEIVRKLVDVYHLRLVPTHEAFIHFLKLGMPYPLTIDGVHMSNIGNMLMAKTWLEHVDIDDKER